MPINLNQDDLGFRPLDNFLFKCAFLDDPNVNNNLTPEILKKLEYSVSRITLPKMKEANLKPHLLGSFAIQFPYFSTGEKEMSIEFYETDDMLVSKVFYSFLNRYRWKASTIFDISHADLMIRVTLLDQRNKNGMAERHARRLVYEWEYWIKTISIDPPQFARDGSDTDLCKVTVNFNTIESKYNNIVNDTFGSADEINVDAKDDNAFENTKDAADKLFNMFKDLIDKPVDNTPSGSKDKTSQYTSSRKFANELGENSISKLVALAAEQNKINKLRNLLQKDGVNVDDYSEVNDALVEIGIFANIPKGWCERGVSVLESIVTGEKRVSASTASSSIAAWQKNGYVAEEVKDLYKRVDAENYIKKLIDEGKLEEGDKIVIHYDSERKQAGHIIHILYDENKGWYTSSDGSQASLTGLGESHNNIAGITILRKSDDRKLLEESSKPVSNIGKVDNQNGIENYTYYNPNIYNEPPKSEGLKAEPKPTEEKPRIQLKPTDEDNVRNFLLDDLVKKDVKDNI